MTDIMQFEKILKQKEESIKYDEKLYYEFLEAVNKEFSRDGYKTELKEYEVFVDFPKSEYRLVIGSKHNAILKYITADLRPISDEFWNSLPAETPEIHIHKNTGEKILYVHEDEYGLNIQCKETSLEYIFEEIGLSKEIKEKRSDLEKQTLEAGHISVETKLFHLKPVEPKKIKRIFDKERNKWKATMIGYECFSLANENYFRDILHIRKLGNIQKVIDYIEQNK